MFYKYLILFIFCISTAYSQSRITGVVINAENNSRLPSASVFINNSSRGTITDNEGKFVITGITEANFELVISYAGFTTVPLKITAANINSFHTVRLYPRRTDLAEIKIMSPDKDGWKNWGKYFTETFIGTSDFASQCKIENPGVLKFFYDRENQVLKVYSNGNLIIHNNALGYTIRYQLEEFRLDEKTRITYYLGFIGFEDMAARNPRRELRWDRNRKEAYNGSLLHFMRTVYKGTSVEEGFQVIEKIRIPGIDSAFDKIYRNGNIPKKVINDGIEYSVITPAKSSRRPHYIDLFSTQPVSVNSLCSFDTVTKQMTFYFDNKLRVIYKNAEERPEYGRQTYSMVGHGPRFQTSEMFLVNPEPVIIESNGLYYDPLNIMVSGYWGWCKMAETLPSDYQVEK